jgi:hypothetical protein
LARTIRHHVIDREDADLIGSTRLGTGISPRPRHAIT